MKTKQHTVYTCEYCGQQYTDIKAVTRCQERCAKKQAQRQQWFKDNPPKYRVGDFVYVRPSGGTVEVESISKHPQCACWRYHGTDESGWNNWISSQYAHLLLSRQQADARKRELCDRLQGYDSEDIFFTAIIKGTAANIKPEIETHIILKDKGSTWKR